MSGIDAKGYLRLAGYGAGFGITTSLLSGLSNALVKAPLGFSPLILKNVLKVGVLSGGTTIGIFLIDDKWGVLKHIGIQ